MLEAARRLVAEGRPHAGVELLFTPKEEVGLLGAGAFDHTTLEAELGFVYDQAAPIGDVILGAPARAARCASASTAGRPTPGWSRRRGGRRSRRPRGRSPTSGSAGSTRRRRPTSALINGGSARNIVPEWCELEAEARSHDARKLAELVQEMLDTFAFAASLAECALETELGETLPRLPLSARRSDRAARGDGARALRLPS